MKKKHIQLPFTTSEIEAMSIGTQGVKSIDAKCKIYSQRSTGNPYYSAQVTVNFGQPDEVTYYMDYEYGAENMFEQNLKALFGVTYLSSLKGILNRTVLEKCKHKEVKNFGVAPR